MGRLFVVAWLASVGCASAGGGGADPDARPPGDSSEDPIDAPPPIDAAISVTLTQTQVSTNAASNSVTCGSGENSWYRVFPLADHGITGPFFVTQVTFGAQEAGGSPTVTIKVGTYAGTVGGTNLDVAQMTTINQTTMVVPNQTDPGTNLVAPITATIPAGSNLFVEINNPTNDATRFFYIGASNGGETRPGYVRGPACSVNTPSTTASIGFPQAQINMTVTGTH